MCVAETNIKCTKSLHPNKSKPFLLLLEMELKLKRGKLCHDTAVRIELKSIRDTEHWTKIKKSVVVWYGRRHGSHNLRSLKLYKPTIYSAEHQHWHRFWLHRFSPAIFTSGNSNSYVYCFSFSSFIAIRNVFNNKQKKWTELFGIRYSIFK